MMTHDQLADIASIFKALSESVRLQLLKILMEHPLAEACVSELAELASHSQANVSKHLKVLAQAGLVKSRREGNTIFYRIGDPFVVELCGLCCNQVAHKQRLLLAKLTGAEVT